MSSPPSNDFNTCCAGMTTSILVNRYFNKGSAFTLNEREMYGILGRLPPKVETIEQQVARCMKQFEQLENPINKYQLLANIHCSNTTLFYALMLKYPERMLPIIYTPTVGAACQKFGSLYQRERGFYLASCFKGRYHEILKATHYKNVEIIVVTDGSRILGLGDLGANGMGISLGKCSLYVVGAGLMPRRVLPLLMDVGTNNETLLNDPNYMGQAIRRIPDDEFYACMDEFMASASELWPNAVIQFEDFSNNHCFDMLDRYQMKYRCFNDDIQGTGAVVSAGFVNAIKASGIAAMNQRTVVFGAGSAAVGVVKSISKLVSLLYSVPESEVIKTFYLVDTKGLVTDTRGDKLASHKIALARHDVDVETSAKLIELIDVMKHVKPTAFLGLGGIGPVLTKEMVDIMLTATPRPIVFPLSNPTSKAEVNPHDVYMWTNGSAICASGSPFAATELNGKTYKPSQGNNMYVFPGLGLGIALAQPAHISDDIILTSSVCIHNMLSDEDRAAGMLYPSLTEIRNVSKHVAAAVIRKCQLDKVGGLNLPTNETELLKYVQSKMWKPEYAPSGQINEI